MHDEKPRFEFRLHALKRMLERRISVDEVMAVYFEGTTIENYPDDTPLPSRLVLGWIDDGHPCHLVVAEDTDSDMVVVITAYRPDSELWCPDFKQRK